MEGNILFAFVGITASGKTELARHVCQKHGFFYIKSLTTRERREGEQEYHYLTKDEFEDLIAKNEILEYTEYVGHYYGKAKEPVLSSLKENHSIYTVTVDQIENLKKFYDKTVVFHIRPDDPVFKNTRERLLKRGKNSLAEIEKRMDFITKEFAEITKLRNLGIIEHEIITIKDDHQAAKNEIDRIIRRYL